MAMMICGFSKLLVVCRSVLSRLIIILRCAYDVLSRKALQFAKWDCLSPILPQFPITLFTDKHTIVSSFPPLLYGYAGNGIPSLYRDGYERLTTPCADKFEFVVNLPVPSSPVSTRRKGHSDLPICGEWRKFAIEDYWYYVDGKWVGIIINTISHLWVSLDKSIKLKHPSYHISFCPNADTSNICHLVERSTLGEAKNLAEEYYRAWSNVNRISNN